MMTRSAIRNFVRDCVRRHSFWYVEDVTIHEDIATGTIIARVPAFVPYAVLQAIEKVVRNHIPVGVYFEMADCGHDDCRAHPELGQACYESTL